MSKRSENDVNHDIRMLRHYADKLAVHKEDGGTFTFDQLQETDQLADDLGALSESTTDTSGPRETGGNPSDTERGW